MPAELFHILNDDAVKVIHSICQKIWKSQQWPWDWKRSIFILIPKKGQCQIIFNYHMIVLILHATKGMFKIFQTRFHQYLNWELPNIPAGFRKAEEPEIRLSTFIGSWRKQGNSRKKIYVSFIDYTKAFDCVDHNKLWKILKESPEKTVYGSRSNS